MSSAETWRFAEDIVEQGSCRVFSDMHVIRHFALHVHTGGSPVKLVGKVDEEDRKSVV